MRKKLIMFSLLFLLLLSGCSRISQPDEVSDARDASNKKGSVEDSDLTEIILSENVTTGYLWQYTLEPELS